LIAWLFNSHKSATSLTFGGILKRIFVVLVLYAFAYQVWIFLHIWWWLDHNPHSSAFMEERLEVMHQEKPEAELKHRWVDYAKISMHLKRAVIASEDAKFVAHEGFDWEGIEKAYEKNAMAQSTRSHHYAHARKNDEQTPYI
jgi:monofunctional glycosyltransferase